MNHQDSFAFWSFPLGNWFGVQVRISWFFPLLIAYFLIKPDYTVAMGVAVSCVLVVSVLLHEFGHILGARLTGGSGNEILLWPLGGLAFVRPAEHHEIATADHRRRAVGQSGLVRGDHCRPRSKTTSSKTPSIRSCCRRFGNSETI